MQLLNCLLVDDERLVRLELRALVEEAGCRVNAEATSVEEAVTSIKMDRPDLIFPDIHMPGADGFELLARLPGLPPVIFVTAYEQHAVRAFAVRAVDYLLKPVTPRRLAAALATVREQLTDHEAPPIYVEDRRGGRFLPVADVYLLRAYGHYVRLYHGGGMDLLRTTLQQLTARLPEADFFRCNRSEVVRIGAITKLEALSRGRYRLRVGTEEVVMSEARAVAWRRMRRE